MKASCILPTWNRRRFLPMAIRCFLKQTYRDRELLILDDGDDRVSDLVPANDPRIGYMYLPGRRTVGEKRNLLCDAADGDVICHWDDDDWSAPDRLEDQVERLRESGQPITGYHSLLFYDLVRSQALQYEGPCPAYALGTSLCYRKSFWHEHRFPEKNVGEDNDFVYPNLKLIASADAGGRLVALIHPGNTAEKGGITAVVPRETIPRKFFDEIESRLL